MIATPRDILAVLQSHQGEWVARPDLLGQTQCYSPTLTVYLKNLSKLHPIEERVEDGVSFYRLTEAV